MKDGRIPSRGRHHGGTYGGYATLVGATFTPDIFCCAVDIVGPSNLKTLLNTIPPYWEPAKAALYRRVGDPAVDADFLWSRSPLSRARDIRIPLLIAQGANDPRVKQAESEQIVAALKDAGIDYEYMLFPDEGHGFAKPENRIKFYTAAERFLARYLGGRFGSRGRGLSSLATIMDRNARSGVSTDPLSFRASQSGPDRHCERAAQPRECSDMPRGSWSAVVAGVAACVALPLLAGCGTLKQFGAGSHTAPASTFTVSAHVTTVVINGGAGSIDVTGSARNTVLVSQQSSYSKKAPTVTHTVSGSTLTLGYLMPFATGVQRVVHAACAARRDGQGGHPAGGSVTLTSLAGPVTAQTDAGLITADSLTSPAAVLKSNAGGIVATFTAAPGSVHASTNIGAITLNVPGTAAYKIDTHTYVGASIVTVRKDAASPHVDHREFGPWQHHDQPVLTTYGQALTAWGGSGLVRSGLPGGGIRPIPRACCGGRSRRRARRGFPRRVRCSP